jgi:hypothetical protein
MLKLGSQTGSLTNHLYSRMIKGQPEPVVGMGATLLSWTDREAATIVEVSKTKGGAWLITVQEDDAKRIDKNGLSESQDYKYTPNPAAPKRMFRFDEGKGWREVRANGKGRLVLTGGAGLRIGERDKYHDFSF